MSKTRYAAAVILSQLDNYEFKVYLARRAPEIRFFGGYWVFPGGNLATVDHHDDDDDDLILRLKRCAIRETLEEINILSATLGDSFSATEKQTLKHDLINCPEVWSSFIADYGNELNRLTAVFRVTTPAFSAVRFDTQFMQVNAFADEEPVVDGHELIDGCFIAPEKALRAWQQGEMQIAPPVLFLLELLARYSLDRFADEAEKEQQFLSQGRLHSIYFSPGIFVAPLASKTLPPATTTNTFIVGSDRLYIVDPGSDNQNEQARLFEKIDRLIAAGKTFIAILLTHHHPDHTGAVNILSQRYRLPVRAHPLCYDYLADGYIKGEAINHGDCLDLGVAPDGTGGWKLEALHTPGHTPDHLCFIDSRYHAAIVGDMLSTVSSILIDPPHGHMRSYLDSLRLLLEQPINTLYPAHGLPLGDGHRLIRYYLQHREEREQATIKALSNTPSKLNTLLAVIYDDVPAEALPLASRSLIAVLIKLEEDGICQQRGDQWVLN